MIFVDSNVVIDLIEDGDWTDWSKRALEVQRGPLVANDIVVAEVARTFSSAEAVLVFLNEIGITVQPITSHIAFAAGKAHMTYRYIGGERDAILADFLIGAHAALLGATLVTRDRRRFVRYFPDLTLITPDTHP